MSLLKLIAPIGALALAAALLMLSAHGSLYA
jgi:hypothetical protein